MRSFVAARRALVFRGFLGILIPAGFLVANLAAGAGGLRDFTAEYRHRTWTRDQGLPDNNIQTFLRTSDGSLWVGTPYGFARFDGLRFAVFSHLNTPVLLSDNCTALAEDNEDDLWIGTANGLYRYADHSFKRYVFSGDQTQQYSSETGTAQNWIVSLARCPEGGIWIGTRAAIMRLWRDKLTIYNKTDQGPQEDQALEIGGRVLEDAHGTLWVGTEYGLLHRTGNSPVFHFDGPASVDTPLPRGTPTMAIQSLAQGRDGSLWCVAGPGVRHPSRLLRFADGHWIQPFDASLPWQSATTLAIDPEGRFWWGGGTNILVQRDQGRLTRYRIPLGATNQCLSKILPEPNGDIWIATPQSGLQLWQPRKVLVYGAGQGMAGDDVWAVCEGRDGSVWIGADGGVSRWDGEHFTNFSATNGLTDPHPRALAEDALGRMWIGTGHTLNLVEDGRVSACRFPGEWENTKIRVIHSGATSGLLWIGTAAGLRAIDPAAVATTHDFAGTNLLHSVLYLCDTNSLSKSDVRALLEDADGALWIGTFGGGLDRYHDGKTTVFTTRDGLVNDFVWSLYEDADGVLWIGTEQGLSRYQGGRFTSYTVLNGLPANQANSVLEDGLGNLWIGHDHGIYRVAKRQLNDIAAGRIQRVHCVPYDEHDGLLSVETNGQKSQPAVCRTRDGRIWFPTTKGVAVFDPRHLPDDTNAPPVVIESVLADSTRVYGDHLAAKPVAAAAGESSAAGALASVTDTASDILRLPPGSAHTLQFDFTANCFTAPAKVRFKYRLAGLEENWVDAGTERKAVYTHLRPGRYRFEVMAGNKYGAWTKTAATLPFYLVPHFYQTWRFYLLCVAALAAVGYGIYRWRAAVWSRIRVLEQQNALLQERQRIAKDLHDGLGASLTQITLLADLAEQQAGAGAERYLQKLSHSSREVVQSLKEIIWAAKAPHATLEDIVSHICQYAESFLGAARIRCRFDLPADLPEYPLTDAERQNLFFAAKEALHNAARHAQASEVRVRARCEPPAFVLEIQDDGFGFNHSAGRTTSDGGNGLTNMRKRMDTIGGRCLVEPSAAGGTRVSLEIPLAGRTTASAGDDPAP